MSLFDLSVAGWRPFHTFDDPAKAVGTAIHWIPGVDWFGDQLKDFGNSTVGKIVLVAVASATYGMTASALAPFTAAGPQLASVTFALPGLARGEPFFKAWLVEFISRVRQTIEILGGQVGADAGNTMLQQIQPAIDKIQNDPAVKEMIDKGVDIQTMAEKAGFRTDVFQAAMDAVQQKASSFAQDATNAVYAGDIYIPAMPAKPGEIFDALTGNLIQTVDPVRLKQLMATEMSVNGLLNNAALAKAEIYQQKTMFNPYAKQQPIILPHPAAIPFIASQVSPDLLLARQMVDTRNNYLAKYLVLSKL